MPHSVLKLRFEKLGADILDYSCKPYLILVDYFSHWLGICPVPSKSSKAVTDAMKNVFTTHGNPKDLKADNNPFRSRECDAYFRSKDITIHTSSLHYHRSN
jgi:hypothetical protein